MSEPYVGGRASDRPRRPGWGGRPAGYSHDVFLFFSNKLGCLGSLALSAMATIVLIAVLRLL